jgi:hypothetical protein
LAKGRIRSHGNRAERDSARDRTRCPGNATSSAGHPAGCNAAGRGTGDTGSGNASTSDPGSRNAGSGEPVVEHVR